MVEAWQSRHEGWRKRVVAADAICGSLVCFRDMDFAIRELACGGVAIVAGEASGCEVGVVNFGSGPAHKIGGAMAIGAFGNGRNMRHRGRIFTKGRWARAVMAAAAFCQVCSLVMIKRLYGWIPHHRVVAKAAVGVLATNYSKMGSVVIACSANTIVAGFAAASHDCFVVIKLNPRPADYEMAGFTFVGGCEMITRFAGCCLIVVALYAAIDDAGMVEHAN
jgi:hypothetical protein